MNLPASAADVRDAGSIPVAKLLRRAWLPTQYSCLRGLRTGSLPGYSPYSIVKSRTRLKRLSSQTGSELKRPSALRLYLSTKTPPPHLHPGATPLKATSYPLSPPGLELKSQALPAGELRHAVFPGRGHHFCAFSFCFHRGEIHITKDSPF